jgi:hypothetical protein
MEQTWQATLMASFIPKEPMLVVIDPDNLLRDESLLAAIQNSSYDILEMEDEITFRNLFERRYRVRWDNGEPRHVVVIVHTTESARRIPYDLLKKGKLIEVGVSELFPRLNAITVRELDRAYYNQLFGAHASLVQNNQTLRGERSTVEFILRTVFGLDPAVQPNPARVVELLIEKHYLTRALPPALENYLAANLLPRIPSSAISPEFFTNAELFYTWLGAQWKVFIQNREQNAYLDDPRLRPLLANLFSDGILDRVLVADGLAAGGWVSVGVIPDTRNQKIGDLNKSTLYNLQARLQRFASLDQSSLPQGKTDLREWLNLAAEWAEAIYTANSLPSELYQEVSPLLKTVRSGLDGHFSSFIQQRYSAVDYYQDNRGPISLAGVNKYLAQNSEKTEKICLLCFDGLSLDQWYLLRDYLQNKITNLSLTENRTYAIAPSITPISRQALFAGKPPVNFAETWDTTTKDADHWNSWWIHKEIPPLRVKHLALKASDPDLTSLNEVITSKNVRLGILVNLFDDVMHSVSQLPPESDKRIFYDTLRSYLENGKLAKIIEALLSGGYRIFITSDHGNISGPGNGVQPPKALIETYARRVAIFDSEVLAREFADQHDAIYFRTKSLPPALHPVYPKGNAMFDRSQAGQISHGGLSIEELIVPFIEVTRS